MALGRHVLFGLDGTARRVTWDVASPAGKCRQVHPAAGDRWVMHFRDPRTGPPWLDDLLAADPGDTECDLAFRVLDRYAEAELKGTGPESRFPGVAVHLRRCEACHQDYRGYWPR